MNDDAWLRELAQVAKEVQAAERARLDERWNRLSAGELSAAEEEELRALAETSPEARQAWEAFRPLGPEFQESVVRALREQRAPAPAAARERSARLLPFRGRATRLGGWLTAAAAVAATLVLLVRVPGQPSLPSYEIALPSGVREMRGESQDAPAVFAPGSRFELVLTPGKPVSGEVAPRLFLARGVVLQRCRVPDEAVQVSSQGAVKIQGTVGREIAIPPGEWTLWAVVGRPGKLPDAAALRAHLASSPPRPGTPDWVVSKCRLKAE